MRVSSIAVVLVATLVAVGVPASAAEYCPAHTCGCCIVNKPAPKLFALDLYPRGFGLKQTLGHDATGLYVSFNETGLTPNDMQIQFGVGYRLPAKLLFWSYYGNGGIEYRYADSSVAPYVIVGTESFGIFFSEYGFSLDRQSHVISRHGIRVRF